jgi:MFS family permease
MGTRAYWILLANMFATGFVGTALLFHMQTMLRQGGLEGTELQAARAIQPWPIVFGVTTLGVGWLVDRFHPARLLPFSLVLMASAILLCLAAARGMVEQAWILPLMAAGMGVYGSSQAMIMGVASPTIARYFGRTHHGSIRGTISTGTVIGTGGGPYAVAWAYDAASGDFTPALLACVGATVPLGIAAGLLTRPTPPAERDLTPEPDEPDMPEPTL